MKKLLSKLIKSVFTAALMAMTFCTISCASSTGGANESGRIDENNLVGSWFWNYGYDQEQFSNEQLTINPDGTLEVFIIEPNYSEWDTGTYSLINDDVYGLTLLINLTQGKEKYEDAWEDIDAKIYYKIETLNSDRLLMKRYKRDVSAMGWIVQEFDPSIVNDYHKIKDGTKENLVGKWTVNKRGTPGIDWDETWIFNEDGTMEDYWTYAGEEPVKYKGTYEVIKEKTGSILHTTLSSEQKGSGTFELNPPMEFWIDYKTCGENLIKVRSLRNMIGGEKHDNERDSDDFYYRDIPLENVTYHIDSFSFEDYYPTGTEYELIDQSRPYLFKGVPSRLCEQYLEGWYDNSAFNGNAITKIPAGQTGSHEYWAKWALNLSRSDWIDDNTKKQDHNHEFYLPISLLTPYMEFPESMENSFPTKGDTVYVALTGKISDDFKGLWGLRIVDQSDGWFQLGGDWHYAEIEKGSFTHIFEIKMEENAKTSDLNKLEFNLHYGPDQNDEARIISDFKFEIFDGNSPKIIEHTLNYGNFIFKQKSAVGYDFTLPTQPDNLPYQTNYWTQQGNDFLGWYDNPDFKGNPVKSISGAENTKAKTFYGKYNLKFSVPEKNDNEYYSDRNIIVKSVIPDVKFNPKKGAVVKVAVSAKVSKDYEGWMGLDLGNIAGDWDYLGGDWHYVETKNKTLKAFFEIPLQKDANFKTIDDAVLHFMYHPLDGNVQLIMSDFKFEFVDEDPFVTTEAESKHVSIKPCAEGFEITVRKLDSDVKDWTGNFNLYIGNITTEGYETDVMIDSSVLNDKKTVTFIWPFCEKGKTYKFNYSWDDGSWHGEYLKVIASTGKGELNFEPLKKMNVTLESNSKEANLCVTNFSKEMIMNVVQKYINQIAAIDVDLPFISGKNDWSDTQWLFGAGCRIYPDFDQNNSFYKDLFANGKSNILGDHNFWWGDKEKINNALSERDTFFTDFRIYIRFKDPLEGVTFYTISNRTGNVPYTPVKF